MLFSVGLVKQPKISEQLRGQPNQVSLVNLLLHLTRASKKMDTKLSNTSAFSASTFEGSLAEQPFSCGKAKFFSNVILLAVPTPTKYDKDRLSKKLRVCRKRNILKQGQIDPLSKYQLTFNKVKSL